jgi:hypothetical protein
MDILTKTCTGCGETKPATSEYWHKQKKGKYGLASKCKVCKAEHQREYRQQPEVKERKREYHREYYQRPDVKERKQEYHREYHREYYQRPEVKERHREYHREYDQRPDVKERKQEYHREYQRERYQRPEVKEQRREYLQRPEVKERLRLYFSKRRARKCSLPDTLTQAQIDRMHHYFGNRCAICGQPEDLFIQLQLDHWIPLSSDDCIGTTALNIVPLCGCSEFDSHVGCNQSKRDKDALEWLIETYGKRQGTAKYQRIMDYFEWVKGQDFGEN